jgi:pilus assembly protein Flp/PilA
MQNLMVRMMLVLRRRDDDSGASLVEYALLVGLIAIVCIAAVGFMGNATSSQYSQIGGSLAAAGS